MGNNIADSTMCKKMRLISLAGIKYNCFLMVWEIGSINVEYVLVCKLLIASVGCCTLGVKCTRNHAVNCRILNSIHVHWDFGCVLHSLKVATPMGRVVKKVHGMLTFIGRDFEYKSWNVMLVMERYSMEMDASGHLNHVYFH